MTKGSRHKARRAAVQALYQWQLTQEPPGGVEAHFGLEQEFAGIDMEYFQQLLSEIPRHRPDLDQSLRPHVDRALEDIDPVERAILWLGAYELEFHPEIPYRVVLDEAVELAKTFGAEHGHRYVNAVLDKLALRIRATEIEASQAGSSTPV